MRGARPAGQPRGLAEPYDLIRCGDRSQRVRARGPRGAAGDHGRAALRALRTTPAARWPARVPALRPRAPHALVALREAARPLGLAETSLAWAVADRRRVLRLSGCALRDRTRGSDPPRPLVLD